MNGWQRIGLVLSIAWAIGSYLYVQDHRGTVYQSNFQLSFNTCSEGERLQPTGKDCLAAGQSFAGIMAKGHEWDAAIVAIVPVPLGWLLVYGLIALWRWIARGFGLGAE